MDRNAEISQSLEAFHRSIADEYVELVKTFNVYAYGFGYKLGILKDVFSDIFVVDFSDGETVITSRNLYEYYCMEPKETDLKRALEHISKLVSRDTTKTVVLVNAKKDAIGKLENLRVVLVQHRELYMSFDDLLEFNYVMRDFTTFISEQKKSSGKSARVDEALNVYDCVGGLSKKIFRLIIKAAASRAEFSLRDIFNKEKKRLLIVQYNSFREALAPFVDSNVLLERSGVSKLNLTKKELAEVISLVEKDD
ncbi:origin recognition complex subunit 2 [Nematocida major]|uniref:origin recognition complex subunit 2 n=1 Tax=Nematocida major TaxID=1912982 RepID=UPI002008A4CB|nr:origin recognition complex subunit 2 [Nematocida major]KAH9386180.1 origin recognition complex subunit 2 [Nematocida major]